ncbi:hypothetical protein YDYSG_06330 [Paenibacillus tyrfis]|uniref:hypothetical protein n=1 Tax=Paenibacillus TaxID=44249 RepID=UPI0024934628|nr:hypothetical protein [Paenibacillus tyrfis]GLI04603.1 hypothetical protein YDYSG_06330 [Paenibacillus tyrfis]GMX65409.1 hypothetical protein Elgi_46790 [Paenibacillus elgii]
MIAASEILSSLGDGTFIERVFSKDVDWDAELDARDEAEFAEAWSSSYDKLEAMHPSEDAVIREIRETVFKQTFRITQSPELAGYVSDDFGLMAKAFDHKIDIEFVNNLWDSYTKGSFPR